MTRIAAITLASDSAITLARSRPSKRWCTQVGTLSQGNPPDKQGFSLCEPLKSLEKKGERTKKSKENPKGKKARISKKARVGGSGLLWNKQGLEGQSSCGTITAPLTISARFTSKRASLCGGLT